jgi:hypothetical protein
MRGSKGKYTEASFPKDLLAFLVEARKATRCMLITHDFFPTNREKFVLAAMEAVAQEVGTNMDVTVTQSDPIRGWRQFWTGYG